MKKKIYKITDEDFARMKKVRQNQNKYKDKKHHFYLSYGMRVFLSFFFVFLLISLSYYCFRISFKDEKDVILKYEEKNDVSYSAKLKDGFINDSDNLGIGDKYIAESVDDIGTTFDYEFLLSEDVPVKYNYRVIATIFTENLNDGAIVSKREIVLVEPTIAEVTNGKVKISQNVNLDYDDYRKSAKDFGTTFNLQVKSTVKIKFLVSLDIDYVDFSKKVNRNQVIEVDVPLLDDVVTFEKNVVNQVGSEHSHYKEHYKPSLENPVILYVGVTLLIFATILFLNIITFINNAKPKKSKYCVLRDGLLKDYDKVIVNSKKMPKVKGLNIIDCYSFQELFDAQKLLEKPIIYFEIVKDQKALFFIIDGDDMYQFVLKECDVDYKI